MKNGTAKGSHPLAVALMVGLLGLVVLQVVASHQTPPLVRLEELPDHAGEAVEVQATVEQARQTRDGGWVLHLRQERAQVQLYTPELEFAPLPGDLVQAVGTVEDYQGQWELDCGSGQVKLIQASSEGQVNLEELAITPEIYLLRTVVVLGNLSYMEVSEEEVGEGKAVNEGGQVSDGELTMLLTDRGKVYTLMVKVRPSLVGTVPALTIDEALFCKGELRYEPTRLGYLLWVGAEDHGLWVA